MLFQEEMRCRNYGCTLPLCSGSVWAGNFIDNSSVELTTRNFYFDRDYQVPSTYPAAGTGHKGLFSKPIQAIPKEPLVLG